jgi:arsenate reductase (thioredoxin)
MMRERVWHVLFLCTGNSARSIMAEVMLRHLGSGRCLASSAGSHPTGTVHPLALATLQSMGLPVDGLRSKSWEECARSEGPPLDLIVTVCDDAAGEVCPIWPGQPITAHWGVEDPAAWQGTEDAQRQKFREVALILRQRIERFLRLPLASLDRMTMQAKLHEIGQGSACHFHAD